MRLQSAVLVFVLLSILLGLSAALQAGETRAVLVAGSPSKGAEPRGGTLAAPFAVDADRQGNLYIAELTGQRVRKLDPRGRLSTIAGTGEKGSGGDGGPALQAQFNGMHHLAVTPGGDLFLADTWNNRVRKIDIRTGVITNLVATGEKGFSGDGGPAATAQCGGIYCAALDVPRNRLLLADLDNRRILRLESK